MKTATCMPFISIILPNYNHASFLKKRIESIVTQTYQDFELIILDDASTDSSAEIIEAYRHHPRVSEIIYNATNSGSPFRQWKKGIERAKGNWIWIAESDDAADISFLEQTIAVVDQHESLGLVYCDSYIIDERSNKAGKYSERKNNFFRTDKWSLPYFNNGRNELQEHLKFFCTINNTSSVVFKKEICLPFLDELTTYIYHGDWFFFCKLCMYSDIFYVNRSLNFYRLHKNSFLNSSLQEIISKTEHFRILQLLLSGTEGNESKKLVEFFSANYLGFGLLQDGATNVFKLFKSYKKINKKLAVEIFLYLMKIKIFRTSVQNSKF